jgi:hypothetical protein
VEPGNANSITLVLAELRLVQPFGKTAAGASNSGASVRGATRPAPVSPPRRRHGALLHWARFNFSAGRLSFHVATAAGISLWMILFVIVTRLPDKIGWLNALEAGATDYPSELIDTRQADRSNYRRHLLKTTGGCRAMA